MLTGKSVRWATVAVGLSVALGVFVYPTDEKRVQEAAAALVSAANAGPNQLSRALEIYARPDVSISAPELLEPLVGRDAIVAALTQANGLGKALHFRIEAVEVSSE